MRPYPRIEPVVLFHREGQLVLDVGIEIVGVVVGDVVDHVDAGASVFRVAK